MKGNNQFWELTLEEGNKSLKWGVTSHCKQLFLKSIPICWKVSKSTSVPQHAHQPHRGLMAQPQRCAFEIGPCKDWYMIYGITKEAKVFDIRSPQHFSQSFFALLCFVHFLFSFQFLLNAVLRISCYRRERVPL